MATRWKWELDFVGEFNVNFNSHFHLVDISIAPVLIIVFVCWLLYYSNILCRVTLHCNEVYKIFAMDVVRRNPKSFLSEKERVGISRVGLLTDIDIQKVACGLRWPDFCITKAITFEKGYHTSEIQVTDIDIQRYCKIRWLSSSWREKIS